MRGRCPSHRAEDPNVNIAPCQIRDLFNLGTHGSTEAAERLKEINPALCTWFTAERHLNWVKRQKSCRRNLEEKNSALHYKKREVNVQLFASLELTYVAIYS